MADFYIRKRHIHERLVLELKILKNRHFGYKSINRHTFIYLQIYTQIYSVETVYLYLHVLPMCTCKTCLYDLLSLYSHTGNYT